MEENLYLINSIDIHNRRRYFICLVRKNNSEYNKNYQYNIIIVGIGNKKKDVSPFELKCIKESGTSIEFSSKRRLHTKEVLDYIGVYHKYYHTRKLK